MVLERRVDMKNASPCQDCESRVSNCHSTCTKYLAYQTINQRENKRKHIASVANMDAGDIRSRSIKKGKV